MVRKPLILIDFVRGNGCLPVTAPGQVGFCHRRWTLDPRYVWVDIGVAETIPPRGAAGDRPNLPIGLFPSDSRTSPHLLERPSALAARACTIVNWKFIGDVRCDSLISAVRNECGFAQWECPCRSYACSKLISRCMPICMAGLHAANRRELKQPRTGL